MGQSVQRISIATLRAQERAWDRAAGHVLKAERNLYNIEQEEATELLGWPDRSRISRIERGLRPVRGHEIWQLARLYKTTAEKLVAEISAQLPKFLIKKA